MLQIGLLIYPMMFDVDLVGPLTFMRRLGDAEAFLVWKDRAPVVSDLGVSYVADHDFESCPKDLDILFVPGGLKGTIPAMQDAAVLDFLADRGARAKYVTSVCTGSLLLGAAGLLEGLQGDELLDGARPAAALRRGAGRRARRDRPQPHHRRRRDGGLDFGLTLAAVLRGEDHAKMLQLAVEYDPQPPFDAGAPERRGRCRAIARDGGE